MLDECRLLVGRKAPRHQAGHVTVGLGDGVALGGRDGRGRRLCRRQLGRRLAASSTMSEPSSLPETDSLNSRIPLPSWRPISGSRLGPKTRSSTSRRMRSSQMPIPKGMGRQRTSRFAPRSRATRESVAARGRCEGLRRSARVAGSRYDRTKRTSAFQESRFPVSQTSRRNRPWHCSRSRTCTSHWRTAPRS